MKGEKSYLREATLCFILLVNVQTPKKLQKQKYILNLSKKAHSSIVHLHVHGISHPQSHLPIIILTLNQQENIILNTLYLRRQEATLHKHFHLNLSSGRLKVFCHSKD